MRNATPAQVAVAQVLLARVQAATARSPYVVRPTRAGFDVTMDLANAQWWAALQRQGLRRTHVHHVALHPKRKRLTITDEAFELAWAVGPGAGLMPRLGARVAQHSGRIVNVKFGRTVATGQTGTGYTFSTEEGRGLITTAAKDLQWSQRLGTGEKVGIAVGFLGLLVAALTVVLMITVS